MNYKFICIKIIFWLSGFAATLKKVEEAIISSCGIVAKALVLVRKICLLILALPFDSHLKLRNSYEFVESQFHNL